VVGDLFRSHIPPESVEEQWDVAGLQNALKAELQLELPVRAWLEQEPDLSDEVMLERIVAKADAAYRAKLPHGMEERVHYAERYVMLQILDAHWREHLAALDHLRQGIHLRGYAQKNPKQEYKREAFELFGAMIESVKLEVTKTLTNVEYSEQKPPEVDDRLHVENIRPVHPALGGMAEAELAEDGNGGDVAIAEAATRKKAQPVVRHAQKVGRNDPCPCGSGKKYKHCHGKLA
jgi:preprotein translocase subunit SecA